MLGTRLDVPVPGRTYRPLVCNADSCTVRRTSSPTYCRDATCGKPVAGTVPGTGTCTLYRYVSALSADAWLMKQGGPKICGERRLYRGRSCTVPYQVQENPHPFLPTVLVPGTSAHPRERAQRTFITYVCFFVKIFLAPL
jgi:hypothetical protein